MAQDLGSCHRHGKPASEFQAPDCCQASSSHARGALERLSNKARHLPPHFNIISSFPKEHLAPISRNRPSSCPPLTRLLFPNSQSRFPLDILRTRIIASKTRNGTTLLLLGCFCSKTEMESKTCQNGFLGFFKELKQKDVICRDKVIQSFQNQKQL